MNLLWTNVIFWRTFSLSRVSLGQFWYFMSLSVVNCGQFWYFLLEDKNQFDQDSDKESPTALPTSPPQLNTWEVLTVKQQKTKSLGEYQLFVTF